MGAGGFQVGTNALITALGSCQECSSNTYYLIEGFGFLGLIPCLISFSFCFFSATKYGLNWAK